MLEDRNDIKRKKIHVLIIKGNEYYTVLEYLLYYNTNTKHFYHISDIISKIREKYISVLLMQIMIHMVLEITVTTMNG